MPSWTFIPLDLEPCPEGEQVFVEATDPLDADLGVLSLSQEPLRQQYFEDQVRRIAWHLGSDEVPVFLDFNGDKRRMDKACIGHAVAGGFLDRPVDGPNGYLTRVVLGGAKRAVPENKSGAQLWREYMREEIAPLFGLKFAEAFWRQGFLVSDRQVFLLVTLDKDDLQEEHRYEDEFLSPTRFQWQSQNRTKQASKHGRIICQVEPGYDIHLFVRRNKKRGSKAAPFTYCGRANFVGWSGEQPITVEWSLQSAIPNHLHEAFKIPA